MFCAYRPTDMTKRITKPPCRQQRDRPPSIISNFSFFKQDRIINSHHNTVSIYCTCFPTGNTPNQPSNRDDDATCALVLFAWFSSENFVSLSGLLRLLCDLRVVRGDCVVSVDLRFCPHFHTLCQQSAGNATNDVHVIHTMRQQRTTHIFSHFTQNWGVPDALGAHAARFVVSALCDWHAAPRTLRWFALFRLYKAFQLTRSLRAPHHTPIHCSAPKRYALKSPHIAIQQQQCCHI